MTEKDDCTRPAAVSACGKTEDGSG